VHEMPSLQSVSPQQALQPFAQHFMPSAQPVRAHLPDVQAAVWQTLGLQSAGLEHWAVTWQPFTGSHVEFEPHEVESAAWPQLPWVQESLVQFTPSSQSPAEQHEPQVAEVLSAEAQQVLPLAHSGALLHLPAVQVSFVHGSLSLHWESSQHSAQPVPGQQTPLAPQSVATWSHSEVVVLQVSVVQGSASSHAVASAQASFGRQPLVAEQYSPALHLALLEECEQPPAKQTSSVQPKPSWQSA